MEDIARELIEGIGLDHTVFNIEMFYHRDTDAVHIIEINPRMSYQFADIFEKVDGTNTYALQLQLSQGRQPEFKKGNGHFGVAASFVLRLFEDRKVSRIPTQEEIAEIRTRFPDSLIIVKVMNGSMLSDLSQDEMSYRYAIINLGGKGWADLYARFEELNQHLKFEFAPALC
jgi:biotin carboxylase